MYALYDYQYVIACSSLPLEFRREFRGLARGRVTSTYDRRMGAKDRVPTETQCRRVPEELAGFEALRAWRICNINAAKRLRQAFAVSRQAVVGAVVDISGGGRETRALCQFLSRITRRVLISLLDATPAAGASSVQDEYL